MLDETRLSDGERRDVPVALGTSHAVFVADGGGWVSLRFFTSAAFDPGAVSLRAMTAAGGHGCLDWGSHF